MTDCSPVKACRAVNLNIEIIRTSDSKNGGQWNCNTQTHTHPPLGRFKGLGIPLWGGGGGGVIGGLASVSLQFMGMAYSNTGMAAQEGSLWLLGVL